ncbi:MAG: heme b synthase [Deltaproteobacteria bacterium]|nr:heme b synthase [Deltaproteobacteria bacterium]
MASQQSLILPSTLRMIAWEVTRGCNLACVHCRASSKCGPYEGELDTARCLKLIDEIAAFSSPVIILTGGEPYFREDIFEIASYGTEKGLRMVLATNGTLVTDEIARRTIDAGVQRVSISLDGPDAASHDAFRGVPGAFEGAMAGIESFKRAGMEFQINTTITRLNLDRMEEIYNLAIRVEAAAHHIFLLVPTGRGREMADQEISAEDYEQALGWFYEQGFTSPIQLKATCAPQYYRIFHQRKKGEKRERQSGASPFHSMTRGCMGGSSFCFISHTGQVQPCGFLEIDCGQIKETGFQEIWNNSKIFNDLRDLGKYKGKCGRCEFLKVCGGCRARAYEINGDYLAEEPLCVYEPGTL